MATLAAALLAVAFPAVVQGQATQPYAVPEAAALLPWSQQIAVREDWLTKRHALLLPMMRRHKVGMWIVVNEEFHDDPLSQYVAPPRPYTGNRDLFVFIDGGHGEEPATVDFECWTPKVAVGGYLAIHDVFPDPADGGRPPYENIYLPARQSGLFEDVSSEGSLRVLRRVR